MEQIIQITELELDENIGHRLKITGTINEHHAREAATHWADENNCLVTEVTFNEEGIHFIAVVCSDDYQ